MNFGLYDIYYLQVLYRVFTLAIVDSLSGFCFHILAFKRRLCNFFLQFRYHTRLSPLLLHALSLSHILQLLMTGACTIKVVSVPLVAWCWNVIIRLKSHPNTPGKCLRKANYKYQITRYFRKIDIHFVNKSSNANKYKVRKNYWVF